MAHPGRFLGLLFIGQIFVSGCVGEPPALPAPDAASTCASGACDASLDDAAERDASAPPVVLDELRLDPALADTAARESVVRAARRVVDAVARRQIAPLADGTYALDTWEEAAANRAPRGISWLYPWGVTLYGMLRASEVTGERAYADFVIEHNAIVGRHWRYLRELDARYGASHRAEVDRTLRAAPVLGALILGSLDNCGAMSNQMVEGALLGSDATPEQGELLDSVASYISTRQSRLPDGAFWRPEQAQTLWIDDLYMSCPFLARWSRRTGDRRYLDDAAHQVIAFARRQQDSDGLWFHANFVGANRVAPFKWGRANGWAMVATVEVLSALPDDHPDRARVLDILHRHIEGVKRLQAPSGRWHQVLDHAELWEETSCTAMFTYSIARAVRRGWIPREDLRVAWRGLEGLAANVRADGSVMGTCEGTGIGGDLGYYAGRGRPPNDPHGPGPVLLAASEVIAASAP